VDLRNQPTERGGDKSKSDKIRKTQGLEGNTVKKGEWICTSIRDFPMNEGGKALMGKASLACPL